MIKSVSDKKKEKELMVLFGKFIQEVKNLGFTLKELEAISTTKFEAGIPSDLEYYIGRVANKIGAKTNDEALQFLSKAEAVYPIASIQLVLKTISEEFDYYYLTINDPKNLTDELYYVSTINGSIGKVDIEAVYKFKDNIAYFFKKEDAELALKIVKPLTKGVWE